MLKKSQNRQTRSHRVFYGFVGCAVLCVLVLVGMYGCASRTVQPTPTAVVDVSPSPTADIFKVARDVLRLKKDDATLGRRSKKKPQFIESHVIELLQGHPELLKKPLPQLVAELDRREVRPDPTKHVRLVPPMGQPGYDDLRVYFSHPLIETGATRPADNLVSAWRDFLLQAKHEIVLNVFDFDLLEIADVLVDKAKAGISVRVGIDKNMISERTEVKRVFDRLVSGGVLVVQVDSMRLNHQKVAAIDWSQTTNARALFSSGNLTQSCLGPEGDLKDVPAVHRPKESIPNANHVITMKSWLAANLINHELSKTFDQSLGLRGASYPMTGAYQITGPGVPPETFEAYPEPSFVITFTPGGGYRDVGKNILARVIEKSSGPIRMIQFAYSAPAVAEALLAKATNAYRTRGIFDFYSVGDTPFALQGWSQFLKMSGYRRLKKNGATQFVIDEKSPWVTALRSEQIQDLRSRVRIAPFPYGDKQVKVGGESRKVNSKVHHKILAAGEYVVMGTSFNFSKGAEANNEQILVFHSRELASKVDGAIKHLLSADPPSVAAEAERRNQFHDAASDLKDDLDDAGP
ncbi:MAG: hypothetical protein JNJ49_12525 [Bdellovibrionaceae bacterium]|nr:hypothetical protein [Pseudobdellovibrionaceae bacterium]